MKEKVVLIGVVSLLVLIIVFTALNITGKAIFSSILCSDNDGGLDYSKSGTVSTLFNGIPVGTYQDQCFSSTVLNEGYCKRLLFSSSLSIQSYTCPNGCKDGACLPETAIKINPDVAKVIVKK